MNPDTSTFPTLRNLIAILLLSSFGSLTAQTWHQFSDQASWQPTAFTATLDGSLLVAHPDYGIYRRGADQGTWMPTREGIGSAGVLAMATRAEGDIFATVDGGLYISEDDGLSWRRLPIAGVAITSLAFDSTGGIIAGADSGRVLRSTDNGTTWMVSSMGYSQTRVLSLATDKNGSIYAGVRDRANVRDAIGGVFRSDDGGRSWHDYSPIDFDRAITTITCAPNGTLIAGRPDASPLHGCSIFRSTDRGTTWAIVKMPHTKIRSFKSVVASTEGHFITDYDGALYRSTDEGVTWKIDPSVPKDAWSIRAIGQQWYAATTPTLYHSTDNGRTWKVKIASISDGLPSLFGTVDVRALASARSISNGPVYAATAGYGLWRCQTNGSQATRLNSALLGDTVLTVMVDRSGRILAGGPGGLFRSNDGGASWVPLLKDTAGMPIAAIAQDSAEALIAATGSTVYYSLDDGATWSSSRSMATPSGVRWMQADRFRRLFAGTDEGLFLSEDHGATWQKIGGDIDAARINAMVLGTNGEMLVATDRGLVAAYEGSTTWRGLTIGLLDEAILSLAISGEGDLYAGTASGLYQSTDDGATWRSTGSRFTSTPVRSLLTDYLTGTLYVGTEGGGLHWSEHFTLSVPIADGNSSIAGLRIVPNPVRATAFIEVTVDSRAEISCTIHALDGRLLLHNAIGFVDPGVHTVPLDLTSLSSGAYIVHVRTGRGMMSSALIVER